MKALRSLQLGDIVIGACVILIITLISWNVYDTNGDTPMVKITADAHTYLYALDAYGTYAVAGALGDTLVQIHEQGVAVIDSPCPDKLCVHSTALTTPGSWNACLPNNVFVLIELQQSTEQNPEGELDAISF